MFGGFMLIFLSILKKIAGSASATVSSRGSIGEVNRPLGPHSDCCTAHAEDEEPTELKKIKKVRKHWLSIASYLSLFQAIYPNNYSGSKLLPRLVMSKEMETNC